ncbi:hypothetical protein ACFCX4_34995 [Kitasatospora sp. NPDC056327]|uniref:hypothetical protein n=1 Tax=Kitasatospora sp. NPDC056327 TaxID=3345785 RepID=UPI0035DAAB45
MTGNQISGSELNFAVQAGTVSGGINLTPASTAERMNGIYREIYMVTNCMIELVPANHPTRSTLSDQQAEPIVNAIFECQRKLESHKMDIQLFAPTATVEAFEMLQLVVRFALTNVMSLNRDSWPPGGAQPVPTMRSTLEKVLQRFAASVPRPN